METYEIILGKIFIAGGFDGTSCLDSSEYYDPFTDQWTMLPEMTSRRSGVVLVALNRELVALGGYNGSDRLASGILIKHFYHLSHLIITRKIVVQHVI